MNSRRAVNGIAVVALLTASLSVITGCQSGVQSDARLVDDGLSIEERARQHAAGLNARQSFQVGGGLGIWTDEETLSARINWLQRPGFLDLTLDGPLGTGTIQLLDEGTEARLERGRKVLARGPSADLVLQQGLGLAAPVPVGELAYWIRGLAGNAARTALDDQGKLSSLQFTDARGTLWNARFRRYVVWDGASVPALITATGGPYNVRLVLKNWRYPTTTVDPETRESNNRLPIPGR